MIGIEGRSAIVTGSTKGIGRSIAEALIDAGSNVAISSRHAAAAEAFAAELTNRGPGHAIGMACDVREYSQCRALVERAAAELGGVDILVNNAGIGAYAPTGEIEPDTWRAVIGTNLDGVFYCTHAALPHMKRAGRGWIINIASLAGKNPFAGGAAYNASKFGVVGFSEALMLDVRNDDIRVSCIMPGSVATDFTHPTGAVNDAWKIQPEDIAQIVLDLLVMPQRTLPSRVEVRPSRPPSK